jgi:16S rRNA (guanine(966)-N(2))-methyltransferase RsmD
MRVISGTAGSIPLEYPRGADIRPTTDAIREFLFSSLADRVVDAVFCDVYAGAGTVGIEALSRGAARCAFIEKDRRCLQALERNLEKTRLADRARVLAGDAARVYPVAAEAEGPFDIVFIDPPYNLAAAGALARRIVCDGLGVASGGLVILQHGRDPFLAEPAPIREKRFGETGISFYELP